MHSLKLMNGLDITEEMEGHSVRLQQCENRWEMDDLKNPIAERNFLLDSDRG